MQKSPFEYSLDNKRYHTLNYYNRNKYGRKIYKAVLDCGFTCPNIDGTRGVGGCVFCDGGSGYFTRPSLTVSEQLSAEIERIERKIGSAASVTAYLQANTNTYASAGKLAVLYDSILEFPQVAGVSIGTRADCLSEEVLDVLSSLNEKTVLTVELGMQTVHEKTVDFINRGYSHEEFLDGYFRLRQRGIRVCLHIINGLPYETTEMMLETAEQTALLAPDAVKIQMLHVIKGTRLAELYSHEDFGLLTRDEYIDITVRQLELLPPRTIIGRVTGDGLAVDLVCPDWSRRKTEVANEIDKELYRRQSYQGIRYDEGKEILG